MSSSSPPPPYRPYYFLLFAEDELTDDEGERWVLESGCDTEEFVKKMREIDEADPVKARTYMEWFICAQVEGVSVAQSESGLYQYADGEWWGEIWDTFGDPSVVMWRSTIDDFLKYCREHGFSGQIFNLRGVY